jgi:DNA (cytosine-5)-methyltransferase 3A
MGINVLSLFDGISCGQIALERAGIKVDNYFASEIDKNAVKVTQTNYTNTIQLGDVTKVFAKDLPKIDLLIGGSPCQGFSFAGKQLNFEDPRSKLFFEFARLLKECKPKYFLLENVKMKKEHEQVITEYLDVEPILINSARLTAHDRKRLYWTNIPNIEQPTDKGIYLKDVLDVDIDDNLYLRHEIIERYRATEKYCSKPEKSCVIGKLSKYQGDRVFDVNCKASSLSASGGNNGGGGCNIIHDTKTNKLRKLSVTECEKLQGVPSGYMKGFKPNAMYKMLGNCWTVDVIAHIFRGLLNEDI